LLEVSAGCQGNSHGRALFGKGHWKGNSAMRIPATILLGLALALGGCGGDDDDDDDDERPGATQQDDDDDDD
jgi:hypothetical protein